jgi:hypothetical protein
MSSFIFCGPHTRWGNNHCEGCQAIAVKKSIDQNVAKAIAEGRAAVGKSVSDCPYGHDNQQLREAWCKAKIEADEATDPLWKRLFFGSNPLSVVISWVVFFAAIAVMYKIIEVIFGCMSEHGRNYC